MKIISLQAANVKRLRAVSIKPNGSPVVIIGGRNAAGKTSTLDAIWMALGGKNALPPKPVREGAEEATITLDLGELVVHRTITADGKTTLKVTGKDGGKYSGPQTILDGLVGNLSFDPLEFSRMDPRNQVETLKGLVGLDFSALDRRKAAKVEERLLVGREVKQLQGQLQGMPQHADAPAAEVSVAELSVKLTEARAVNAGCAAFMAEHEKTVHTAEEWAQRIRELEQELTEAKQQHSIWVGKVKAIAEKAKTALVPVDEQAIINQMSNADALNRKVRENSQRIRVASMLDQKQAAYETFSAEIEAIDTEKTDALARTKFPVDGLSFDEMGVRVKGMPFQQASGAEQLRVSVAMGLALNPKLKVLLVRDGSLLDETSLAMVGEMAAAAGGQVWLERVGDGDESAIVIEDGMVRS